MANNRYSLSYIYIYSIYYHSLPVGGNHKHTGTVNNKYDSVMSHMNAAANIDCSKIYPACSASIWNVNF